MRTVLGIASLALLSLETVQAGVVVLTRGCNAAFPTLECGGGCTFKCPFGFPCTSGNDCATNSCDPQGYCTVPQGTGGIVTNPDTPTFPSPPSNSGGSGSTPNQPADPAPPAEVPSGSGNLRLGSTCTSDNQCSRGLKCFVGKCQEFWEAPDFKDGLYPDDWNVVKNAWGKDLTDVVEDPAGGSAQVLRSKYPAGSRNPGGPIKGGFGIYAIPIDISKGSSVTMEFQIYFPAGFNWVLGGKLPGLYGGQTGCSGGATAKGCFSTRYMWRPRGAGEIYLYADKDAQVKNFCDLIPNTICNPVYGMSIGRGAFFFKDGEWNTVRQTVTLNTFDSNGKPIANGIVEVYLNNDPKPVLYLDKIVYRTSPTIGFTGMMVDTFFGGSSNSFSTPTTQYTYFKGFKLGYH